MKPAACLYIYANPMTEIQSICITYLQISIAIFDIFVGWKARKKIFHIFIVHNLTLLVLPVLVVSYPYRLACMLPSHLGDKSWTSLSSCWPMVNKTRPGDLVMPDPFWWFFNENLDYFRPYKNQVEPDYKGHPIEFMVDFLDQFGPFGKI